MSERNGNMGNVNERNMTLINETVAKIDRVNSEGVIDLPLVKGDFLTNAILWNNITVKIMELYVTLYNSIEVINEENRRELCENIEDTLKILVATPEYKYYESAMNGIYRDIKDDTKIAADFAILSDEEAKTIYSWADKKMHETNQIKDNVIENFRFASLEFSLHNHFMRLDGIHSNGLTNSTIINKILNKIYEDNNNCAQILRKNIEDRGFYARRVANILSDGTMIELYLEFENTDGCGTVRFVRNGAKNEEVLCFNKQEGFDASLETEAKDPIIERCMAQLFSIVSVAEKL